jgi:hypothetical protein
MTEVFKAAFANEVEIISCGSPENYENLLISK